MTLDQAVELLQELEELRGKLRNHQNLLYALRDYDNTAGWLLRLNGGFDSVKERTEMLAELEERYRAVLCQTTAIR